jgi:hypothetical protein
MFTGNPVEGTVFGSYGLQYPVDDIERERSDGVTIIDLKPETRVFVCGGEITKDVINVQVDRHLDSENTCSITHANPRGKYNVSLQDLMGNWREDKDILAAYDYDWLKTNQRNVYDQIDNVLKTVTGNDLAAQIKDLVKNFLPRAFVVPVTKMIFDVKHASGITKKEGDVIFDYRDPVYVFMKGRFSPYWYFAFSGVVSGHNEQNRYGGDQTLNLQCHDILYLLRRKKFYERGAMITAANLEASVKNLSSVNSLNIFDLPQNSTPSNIIKYLFYNQKQNVKDLDRIKNLSFYDSGLSSDILAQGYGDESKYNTQDRKSVV